MWRADYDWSRLVAEAPELLKVAEILVERVNGSGRVIRGDLTECVIRARAAIRRVTAPAFRREVERTRWSAGGR